MELNNSNNNNNSDNNNSNNSSNNNYYNNNDTDRAEWKIQLTMQKSEPVEIFMSSNTEDVIDKLFNTILQRFQRAQETSNERGS